jgi:hypothetical protein
MTWRDIPGFETLYQVSRDGSVLSLERTVQQGSRWGHAIAKAHHGRVMTPYRCKNGRRRVVLHDAAHRRHARYVDDLVAETFGLPPSKRPEGVVAGELRPSPVGRPRKSNQPTTTKGTP